MLRGARSQRKAPYPMIGTLNLIREFAQGDLDGIIGKQVIFS